MESERDVFPRPFISGETPSLLIDSHAHLDSPRYTEDRAEMLRRAADSGVGAVLSIGIGEGPAEMHHALEICREFNGQAGMPHLYASAGIYPHSTPDADDAAIAKLDGLLQQPEVIACGEIGLDYYHDGAGHHVQRAGLIRQLEVAELMVSANNYTFSYVNALLATSKAADLHRPDELRKATGLSTEQMARLEREMAAVSQDYKELEMSYGDDMLVLVVAAGFLERLLSKPDIERFLAGRHPEFLENFRAIVLAASLDQTAAAA